MNLLRLDKHKECSFMYKYTVWPGAYSFKEEISLFVLYFKEQLDDLINQIEETEKALNNEV